jgi:hypothetical protein
VLLCVVMCSAHVCVSDVSMMGVSLVIRCSALLGMVPSCCCSTMSSSDQCTVWLWLLHAAEAVMVTVLHGNRSVATTAVCVLWIVHAEIVWCTHSTCACHVEHASTVCTV